jgi:hypothetical protein
VGAGSNPAALGLLFTWTRGTQPHSYCFIPALGCEGGRATAHTIQLLTLDSRGAKLAGGFSSDHMLSSLRRKRSFTGNQHVQIENNP